MGLLLVSRPCIFTTQDLHCTALLPVFGVYCSILFVELCVCGWLCNINNVLQLIVQLLQLSSSFVNVEFVVCAIYHWPQAISSVATLLMLCSNGVGFTVVHQRSKKVRLPYDLHIPSGEAKLTLIIPRSVVEHNIIKGISNSYINKCFIEFWPTVSTYLR